MEGSVTDKRIFEAELHRELMNSCRKYFSKIGIVSVVGMLEIVKQETLELEHAAKHEMKSSQD